MHVSLFSIYFNKWTRGFYVLSVGDEDFDSALLAFHMWTTLDVTKQIRYKTYSVDILWYSLMRKTFSDIFRKKDNKSGEGTNDSKE